MGLARAHRVTYVGELGWELYVSSDQAAHVFEALEAAGAELGLKLCGLHTLDCCRIEKAFRHFGHDITDEDHVLEAGLRLCREDGQGRFHRPRGSAAQEGQGGLERRMVQFRLTDPEPLLFHNEALVRDGRIVSTITSGNYGHLLGGAIGLGYVPCEGESEAEVLASNYEIEIAGMRVKAEASLAPMYDPKGDAGRMWDGSRRQTGIQDSRRKFPIVVAARTRPGWRFQMSLRISPGWRWRPTPSMSWKSIRSTGVTGRGASSGCRSNGRTSTSRTRWCIAVCIARARNWRRARQLIPPVFAALMLINAVFFHILPVIRTKGRFSPGLATAVVLFLPLGTAIFVKVAEEGHLDSRNRPLRVPRRGR